MSEILVSTEDEFYDAVEGNPDVVILFTAPAWCGPCKRLEPHWNKAVEMAEANALSHTFVKIDMGETPEDTGEHWASKEFNILGVPQIKRLFSTDTGAYTVVDVKARAVVPLLKEIDT